jgi:hypothetical protein
MLITVRSFVPEERVLSRRLVYVDAADDVVLQICRLGQSLEFVESVIGANFSWRRRDSSLEHGDYFN